MLHLATTSHSGARPTAQNESLPGNARSVNSALTICADSASSCARTMEYQLRRGFNYVYIPNVIETSYIAAATLVLSSWNLKLDEKGSLKQDIKPPIAQSISQKMSDIKFFVQTLESLKARWGVVDSRMSVNYFRHHLFGADFMPVLTRQEIYESLQSLEGFGDNLRQPRGRHLSTTDINQDSEHQPPPIFMRAYQAPRTNHTLRSRHSIADLAPHSRTEVNRYDRPPLFLPSVEFQSLAQSRVPLPRPQSDFDPVDSLLQFSGRSQHTSSSIPLSSRDRTLPFISSMRRTSHPNLSSREQQHISEGIYGSRTSSGIHHHIPPLHNDGPSRYQDVDMHFEDEVYPQDARYHTSSSIHSSHTKPSGIHLHHRGYR